MDLNDNLNVAEAIFGRPDSVTTRDIVGLIYDILQDVPEAYQQYINDNTVEGKFHDVLQELIKGRDSNSDMAHQLAYNFLFTLTGNVEVYLTRRRRMEMDFQKGLI